MELEKITAELPFGTDATAWLKAGGGFYSNSKSTLELSRDIVLTTSDGMQAKLKSARIDIGKNGLSTNEPVDITSKGSRITADSLQVSEGGKLLVFEKRVRLTIDPKNLDPQNSKSADGGGQVQQTE